MLRRLAVASVVLTAACAGQQKTGGAEGARQMTAEERVRITNQPPFDLVACAPRELELPQQTNDGVILGALLTTRPLVMECLVDPKNRGPAQATRLEVKATVNDQGTTYAVTGENLTPAGQACIQKAVESQVKLSPLPAGAKPVEASIPFEHTASSLNSVTFGINAGSDFSGAVRLAQPTWCDCYAPFKDQVPPALTVKVKLTQSQQTPAELTSEPSGTTEGDQLAACLKGKMATLPAKLSAREVSFKYVFHHFNSRAPETAGAANAPELRFLQLDLVRGQKLADAAIADGSRAPAAQAYVEVVERYQKTKDTRLFNELSTKCETLVNADKRIVEALKARQASEQAAQEVAAAMLAKDPEGWKEAADATQKNLDTTQKELTEATTLLEKDKGICPKMTYDKKKK